MKKHQKLIIAFMLSQLLFVNNVIQMYILPGNEIVNILAIWESSSFIVLCLYYLYVFFGLLSKDEGYIHYFPARKLVAFFGHIAIRVLSVLVTVIYVHKLHNMEALYIVQLVLLIADGVLGGVTVKYVKYLDNHKLNICNIKAREIKMIPCTEDQYNDMVICVAITFFLSIVNMDYFFILMIRDTSLPCLMAIMNCTLIQFFIGILIKREKYLDNRTCKYVKRSKIYLNLANIISMIMCMVVENIFNRCVIVVIWGIGIMVYVFVKILLPVVDISNGMDKYLHNEDNKI